MAKQDDATQEIPLIGGRSTVTRLGGVVFRQSAPWSASTVALLRHLEQQGFDHSPRVIGTGFDAQGREMLTFVEGESIHPMPWDDTALPVIGQMLRKLHTASASFVASDDAMWRPWYGRAIGRPSVIGHCDTGSWNIISRDGKPVALVDWEEAGPVDPLVELAQACWLNAQLFDDDLAERYGLPSIEGRGRQVKMLLDGYELPRSARVAFVALIRDFAILSAAHEAIEAQATPDMSAEAALGIVWRTRSAGWLVKHHDALQQILDAPV